MAIKIFWSKRAEQGYADIVRYLEEEWTEKEIRKFVVETNHEKRKSYWLVLGVPEESH